MGSFQGIHMLSGVCTSVLTMHQQHEGLVISIRLRKEVLKPNTAAGDALCQ